MAEEARYAFDVSWFDPIASMTRKYQLIHYASDGTIEMVQLRPFATPATRGCPGSVLPTTPPPLASQLRNPLAPAQSASTLHALAAHMPRK